VGVVDVFRERGSIVCLEETRSSISVEQLLFIENLCNCEGMYQLAMRMFK